MFKKKNSRNNLRYWVSWFSYIQYWQEIAGLRWFLAQHPLIQVKDLHLDEEWSHWFPNNRHTPASWASMSSFHPTSVKGDHASQVTGWSSSFPHPKPTTPTMAIQKTEKPIPTYFIDSKEGPLHFYIEAGVLEFCAGVLKQLGQSSRGIGISGVPQKRDSVVSPSCWGYTNPGSKT